ncbi:hypothetical protein JMUB7549_27650 [Staphylococcus aureus]
MSASLVGSEMCIRDRLQGILDKIVDGNGTLSFSDLLDLSLIHI